jgi:hypothetical protein
MLPVVTAGKVILIPDGAHIAVGFVMFNTGVGLTTPTILEVPTQLAYVTVTVYKPLSADVAPGTVTVEPEPVNPLGPVQAYVAPAVSVELSVKVFPAQTIPPVLAVGVGAAGSFKVALPVFDVQPAAEVAVILV